MGAPRTTDKIIDFLSEHQNITVTLSEIMKVTSLTKDQVQNGVNNLRTRHGFNIETLVAGNAWKYMPTGPAPTGPQRTMFELVGQAKAGLVIQDEDGKLYKAEEL